MKRLLLLILVTVSACSRAAPPAPHSDPPASAADTVPPFEPPPDPAPSAAIGPEEPPPPYASALPKQLPKPIAILRARCQAGQHQSCVDYARTLTWRDHGLDRPFLAASVLRKSCDAKHLPACRELGRLYLSGTGVPWDLATGTRLIEGACDGGDAEACQVLGEELENGQRLVQALEGARTAYRKGCELEYESSCKALERMVREGIGGTPDPDEANKWLARATKYASHKRPGPYEAWEKLVCPEDPGCAERWLSEAAAEKRCERGDPDGCFMAEHMLSTPEGKDGKGLRLLNAACRGGLWRGCWAMAHRSDRARALEALKATCAEGELAACHYLVLPRLEDQNKVDPDRRRRVEFACMHGHGMSCAELLYALSKAGATLAELAPEWERACPLIDYRIHDYDRSGVACRYAGDARRSGQGLAKDDVRAAELYRRGCFAFAPWSGRDLEACLRLAEMMDEGAGVPKDQVHATAILAGACHARVAEACQRWADRVEKGIGAAPDPLRAERIKNWNPTDWKTPP